MYFIVGLGNPGKEYALTRHNVGWMFVEYLQKRVGLPEFKDQKKLKADITRNSDLCLIKPTTYMNRSGEAVYSTIHYYDQETLQGDDRENVIVVHDDLDLSIGSYKLQFGKGPKVHNGVNSVRTHLKSSNFWYIRIGIDNRQGVRTMPGQAYVLQPFTALEQQLITTVFAEIYERLHTQIEIH